MTTNKGVSLFAFSHCAFGIAGALAAALALFSPRAAHAQFGSAFVPTTASQEGGFRPRRTTANLFLTNFYGKEDLQGREDTVPGLLLSLESGNTLGEKRSFKYGAWYFRANDVTSNAGQHLGNVSFYEGHGKFYFTPRVGVQFSLLGARDDASGATNTPDANLFALYNVARSGRGTGGARRGIPMALQLGAGGYYFGDLHRVNPTGFIQGSVEFVRNVSFDTSVWYIDSPYGHFVRSVAGIGYRF